MLEVLKKIPLLKPAVRAMRRWLAAAIPDRVKDYWIVRYRYRKRRGRSLSLRRPETLSEKIQWIKLYDHKPIYTELADKYTARRHVEAMIGKQYLVDLYGVYETVGQIDFDALPDAFVLKAVHGSGWNILCPDKNALNREATLATLDGWLHTNYYDHSREWVYKDIPPRIVCEEFLRTEDGRDLADYKLFCLNGEPRIVQVDLDRFHGHRRNLYDTDWNRLPFGIGYPPSPEDVPRPETLEEMLRLARRLSSLALLMRVDFYWHGGRIYFGEMTFYPGNGLETFDPPEYDRVYGAMLTLPGR